MSPSVPAAAAAFAQQQQGALSSGPGVDGPPGGVHGDARYVRGLLVEIARATCEVSAGSRLTYMLHQVLVHSSAPAVVHTVLVYNTSTSAKIGALRAPFFSYWTASSEGRYMLMHVYRTIILRLKTGSCTVFDDR